MFQIIKRLDVFYYFSAGGLVTAVAPVVVQGNGLWIGWPGVHLEKGEKIPESDPNDTTPTAGLRSDKVGYLIPIRKDYYIYRFFSVLTLRSYLLILII